MRDVVAKKSGREREWKMDDIETLRIHHQHDGAAALVIGTLLQMLIEKGVLHRGEVIGKLEGLSRELMAQSLSTGAMGFIDVCRDMVAGEVRRKPS
jgi:hypothetical protein